MKLLSKIKQSRRISFLAVLLVYIIATTAGILTYKNLNFDWWLNLLISDIIATVMTFIFSLIFKNASVYDPYWSVQPIVILVAFSLSAQMTIYKTALLAAVCFWGVRLTLNWAYTFLGLNHQDWRYTMLCKKTGAFYPLINFLGIHLVPTLIVYLCIVPAVYTFINKESSNLLSMLLLLICIFATVLQGVSDIQMHCFRKEKSTNFIRCGLWKYSRHPNYLGEILMWWGVAASVVATYPSELYLLVGAVANTILFLVVSIPMADKRQSRKPGFDTYKKETRMLLPIKK